MKKAEMKADAYLVTIQTKNADGKLNVWQFETPYISGAAKAIKSTTGQIVEASILLGSTAIWRWTDHQNLDGLDKLKQSQTAAFRVTTHIAPYDDFQISYFSNLPEAEKNIKANTDSLTQNRLEFIKVDENGMEKVYPVYRKNSAKAYELALDRF